MSLVSYEANERNAKKDRSLSHLPVTIPVSTRVSPLRLMQWKPKTLELRIQIVLCGCVFVILPLFLIATLFKVGLQKHSLNPQENF